VNVKNTSTAQPCCSYSKYIRWWPALIGPAVLVALVFLAERLDPGSMKYYPELISPPLLGIAAALFALRAWRTGNPLCAILTGLAVAFTCREIHFEGTDIGVKVALGILVVWTVLWRKRLAGAVGNITHVRWVVASALTYALSMVVAKRVFSSEHLGMIPNEGVIHVTLEEGLELTAHLLLLLSAVMGGWKISTRRGDSDRPVPQSAPK